MKKFNLKTKIVALASAGLMSVAMVAPCGVALAADYPGVDQATSMTTGNTATTAVGLKADNSQISFSASTTVNFAVKADGSFEYPTANVAKITNDSVFDIVVKSFAVTSDTAANGVASSAYDSASGDNTYTVQVTPSGGSAVDFSVSQTSLSSTDWKIAQKSGTTDTDLGLSFSNGKIKSLTNIWGSGHNLQSVVWTVGAATA